MKINLKLFKKNVYWVISLILFGLVVIFSSVMLITLEIGAEADETSIGFIFLGNRSADERESVISQGIQTWQEQAQYTIRYQGYQIPVNLNIFAFDMEKTTETLVSNQNNLAIFNVNESEKSVWLNTMTSIMGATIMDTFDDETFFDDVLDDVMTLSRIKSYDLVNYLDTDLMDYVLNTETMTSISSDDVDDIITAVTDIVIPKMSRFSLLDALNDLTLNNEQLSIIASGILSIIDDSHFTSLDFEIYQYLPSWATQGQNVRILEVNDFDLSFYNSSMNDYRIHISNPSETSLRFELMGYPYITEYASTTQLLEVIAYQTIIYDDETIDALTPGVIITETATEFIYQVVIQNGTNGAIYETLRTMTPYQGDVQTITIYIEHYLPIDEIIHQHIVEKGG